MFSVVSPEKDLDGNNVDESLFSKNAVTVVNFWFSGCKPCVAELPELNKLNETLKEMGGEVVGINTETLDDNQDGIKKKLKNLRKTGGLPTVISHLIQILNSENMLEIL